MNQRRLLKYPPYYYIILLNIKGKDINKVSQESKKIYKELRNKLQSDTIILGPTPANIFKINNIYCYQIIIKYRYDTFIEPTLKNIDVLIANNNDISFEIDMNPINL